jgi:hypothetical protein
MVFDAAAAHCGVPDQFSSEQASVRPAVAVTDATPARNHRLLGSCAPGSNRRLTRPRARADRSPGRQERLRKQQQLSVVAMKPGFIGLGCGAAPRLSLPPHCLKSNSFAASANSLLILFTGRFGEMKSDARPDQLITFTRCLYKTLPIKYRDLPSTGRNQTGPF